MKMCNIRSPWRYDAGACVTPPSPKLRLPAKGVEALRGDLAALIKAYQGAK
jgi:hypothetical protein